MHAKNLQWIGIALLLPVVSGCLKPDLIGDLPTRSSLQQTLPSFLNPDGSLRAVTITHPTAGAYLAAANQTIAGQCQPSATIVATPGANVTVNSATCDVQGVLRVAVTLTGAAVGASMDRSVSIVQSIPSGVSSPPLNHAMKFKFNGAVCNELGNQARAVQLTSTGLNGNPLVGEWWCVDRYENIVFADSPGTKQFDPSDTIYGQAAANIPAALSNAAPASEAEESTSTGNGNCDGLGNGVLCVAASIDLSATALGEKRPTRFISYHQARRACAARGSGWKLAPENVWNNAAAGTPAAANNNNFCQTSGANAGPRDVGASGSSGNCQSTLGIRDAIGNVDEWVDGDESLQFRKCGIGGGVGDNLCTVAGGHPVSTGGTYTSSGATLNTRAPANATDQADTRGFRCAKRLP